MEEKTMATLIRSLARESIGESNKTAEEKSASLQKIAKVAAAIAILAKMEANKLPKEPKKNGHSKKLVPSGYEHR